jgi:DNA-binding CsgD family transcriptional regulator
MKDLSPRQREILALVAAGRTSKEIAGELGISESTVNWHLSNVFERLGASSRAEAVAIAMREEAEGDGEVVATDDAPPRARPSLRVTEVALAFVLTLLLGLIGGALIAEWDRKAPPIPLSPASAAPSSGASETAGPTGRPLVDAPDSDAHGAPVPADATSPTARPTLVPNVTPNELPVGPLPAPRVHALPAGIGLPSLP